MRIKILLFISLCLFLCGCTSVYDMSLEDVVNECNSGDLITLPTYTVSGGAGKVNVKKYYLLNGVESPIEGDTFRPEIPGEYKIIYRATDYAHQQVDETYNLNVIPNGTGFNLLTVYESPISLT